MTFDIKKFIATFLFGWIHSLDSKFWQHLLEDILTFNPITFVFLCVKVYFLDILWCAILCLQDHNPTFKKKKQFRYTQKKKKKKKRKNTPALWWTYDRSCLSCSSNKLQLQLQNRNDKAHMMIYHKTSNHTTYSINIFQLV